MPGLNRLETQQKMQFAPRRSNGKIGKTEDGGTCTLLKKSLGEKSHKYYTKDHGMSAIILKNSDQRRIILTWVTVELDAHCKILAPIVLPIQCSDWRNRLGNGTLVKMNGQEPVCSSTEILFDLDKQKEHTSHPPPGQTCCEKIFTPNSSASVGIVKSRNRGSLKKRTKSAISKSCSHQNCNLSSDSSCSGHDAALGAGSADLAKDGLIGDKPKKSSRKKSKKKRRQQKKPSSCSIDTAVVSERVHGMSALETRSDSGLGYGCSLERNFSENATHFSDSLCDIMIEKVDKDIMTEKVNNEDSNGRVNFSVTTSKATSCSDDVELLETEACLPQDSAADDYGSKWLGVDETAPLVTTSIIETTEVTLSGSGGETLDANSRTANCDNCCSKVVADSKNNCERTESGNRGCRSGENFSVILGKKCRKGRKYLVESNENQRVTGVNGHVQVGKETNYSVCQKVHKTDIDECLEPVDRDPVCSDLDASEGGVSFAINDTCMEVMNDRQKSTRAACLDEISAQTNAHERSATIAFDCGNLRNVVSEELKRRITSASKIENGQNFKKSSHTGGGMMVRPMKLDVPQKEALDIQLTVNNCKSFGAGSESSIFFNYLSSSVPQQDSHIHSQETKTLGDAIASTPDMDAQDSQNQAGTLSAVSDYLENLGVESDISSKFCKDEPEDLYLHTCDESMPTEQETYASQVGNSSPGHRCGPIPRKWVPVVEKDADTLENLSNSLLDDPFSDRWNLMSTEEGQLSSEFQCRVPSTNAQVTFLSPCSEGLKDEVTCRPRYDAPVMLKEQSSVHVASGDQTIHKSNEQGIFINQIHSSKITHAVNEAYRMQILSEGVQLATGTPLAEFERFLQSASPVLDRTSCVQHCRDLLIGDSLSRHQLPNISLGSLWQSYEMPGSYGVEVKAEDYHILKRFGSGRFQFCAYFVPFLSAVQLFGQSRSSMSACDAMSNDCLFPSGHDQVCKLSVSSACVRSHAELLFEYFESEQPWNRRPLYEKVQELIRGNAGSNSHMFGDPVKLESLHLHDLHPASWYSVAWYPIYRIPDGNFRAAFLTYHSLGHFIQNTSSDSLGGGASIAFPAVGLKSYNAQGECWFQPRNFMMMQMERPLPYNPSEILNERLKTLEQTAYAMARASLCKGDHKLLNRQPDYEFFLSRRR